MLHKDAGIVRGTLRAGLRPALLLLLPLLISCAGRWASEFESPQNGTGNQALAVYNNHPENIRVYMLVGSTAVPLGTVESFTARRLEIPSTAAARPVPILIKVFGSRATFTTHEVDFVSQPEFELRVGTNLKMTTINVRR